MICFDIEQHCAGVEGLGAVESTHSRWFAVKIEKNGGIQTGKSFIIQRVFIC